MLWVLIKITSARRFKWVPTTYVFMEKWRKLSLNYLQIPYETRHDKTNKMSVRPAKTQIRPVWSESLLSAWRKLRSLATHWAHRLGRCPGWSESSLGAHSFCWFCHVVAHICFTAILSLPDCVGTLEPRRCRQSRMSSHRRLRGHVPYGHHSWLHFSNTHTKRWAYPLPIESPDDKTNKITCVPSEDSYQPGHTPRLIRVFAVRMKKLWVPSYPLSTQWRLWSDLRMCRLIWVFAGNPCHFVGFVMLQLKISYLGYIQTTESLFLFDFYWFHFYFVTTI